MPGNTLSSCVADNVHYPAKFITRSKTTPSNYYHIMPKYTMRNTNTQTELTNTQGDTAKVYYSQEDHTFLIILQYHATKGDKEVKNPH